MSASHHSGDAKRSGVANRGRRQKHPASDRIHDQARVVTKDVEKLGGIVRDVTQEKIGELREGAAEYYGQARGKMRQAEGAVIGFVGRRPVTSLLLGVGFGLLFGRFWRRR